MPDNVLWVAGDDDRLVFRVSRALVDELNARAARGDVVEAPVQEVRIDDGCLVVELCRETPVETGARTD